MSLSLPQLLDVFRGAGATRVVAKPLAENDNSKQQIYLGGSFQALEVLPFNDIVPDKTLSRPNFKAKLSLAWITPTGNFEPAEHAQLILYPDYPEIRLSGFLKGCAAAPSAHMKPIPKEGRRPKNSWDGRVLFFGITDTGRLLAALSVEHSEASKQFDEQVRAGKLEKTGVLYSLRFEGVIDTRRSLLDALGDIKQRGWVPSVRMTPNGEIKPYQAKNGGGYTLEAMLNIKPNSRAEPDYLGWEVKAYGTDRVTLMTPEPDAGYYGEHGVEAFLRKYGYRREDDTIYFTGTHRVGQRHQKTGQMLSLEGFDPVKAKIVDVTGGITMQDQRGDIAAVWTYRDLIAHWSRKHANAAYVPYERHDEPEIEYRYLSPALLGVGTDFILYLQAMYAGKVVYDPAPKLTDASTSHSRVKARSQFRISVKQLQVLYEAFGPAEF